MDRSYVAENAVERARLKTLVARLSDAEMARPTARSFDGRPAPKLATTSFTLVGNEADLVRAVGA